MSEEQTDFTINVNEDQVLNQLSNISKETNKIQQETSKIFLQISNEQDKTKQNIELTTADLQERVKILLDKLKLDSNQSIDTIKKQTDQQLQDVINEEKRVKNDLNILIQQMQQYMNQYLSDATKISLDKLKEVEDQRDKVITDSLMKMNETFDIIKRGHEQLLFFINTFTNQASQRLKTEIINIEIQFDKALNEFLNKKTIETETQVNIILNSLQDLINSELEKKRIKTIEFVNFMLNELSVKINAFQENTYQSIDTIKKQTNQQLQDIINEENRVRNNLNALIQQIQQYMNQYLLDATKVSLDKLKEVEDQRDKVIVDSLMKMNETFDIIKRGHEQLLFFIDMFANQATQRLKVEATNIEIQFNEALSEFLSKKTIETEARVNVILNLLQDLINSELEKKRIKAMEFVNFMLNELTIKINAFRENIYNQLAIDLKNIDFTLSSSLQHAFEDAQIKNKENLDRLILELESQKIQVNKDLIDIKIRSEEEVKNVENRIDTAKQNATTIIEDIRTLYQRRIAELEQDIITVKTKMDQVEIGSKAIIDEIYKKSANATTAVKREAYATASHLRMLFSRSFAVLTQVLNLAGVTLPPMISATVHFAFSMAEQAISIARAFAIRAAVDPFAIIGAILSMTSASLAFAAAIQSSMAQQSIEREIQTIRIRVDIAELNMGL